VNKLTSQRYNVKFGDDMCQINNNKKGWLCTRYGSKNWFYELECTMYRAMEQAHVATSVAKQMCITTSITKLVGECMIECFNIGLNYTFYKSI